MPTAASIQPDTRFFGLFISRSGAGKSTAAYSFPHDKEGGNIHVLDLDGRIRGGLTEWISRDNFNYDYFPPKPEKGTTFESLNKWFEATQIMLGQGQAKIQTLVLDSATWLANDLLLDAMPITHEVKKTQGDETKGRKMGPLNIAGPDDYKFQSSGIMQTIAYLRTIPIKNVIVTAHIVNRWGKRKDKDGKIIDAYGQSEIVGEQLALTDKIAETLPNSFDHVFRFEKVNTGSKMKFTFEAQGELARSAYPIPYGQIDITGQDFYKVLMGYAKGEKK